MSFHPSLLVLITVIAGQIHECPNEKNRRFPFLLCYTTYLLVFCCTSILFLYFISNKEFIENNLGLHSIIFMCKNVERTSQNTLILHRGRFTDGKRDLGDSNPKLHSDSVICCQLHHKSQVERFN